MFTIISFKSDFKMSCEKTSCIESIMIPPAMVDENDSITVVAKVLLQTNKGCVFVASGGEVIGIITERDVLRFILKEGGIFSPEIEAKDFMVKPVVSISKSATISDADDLMYKTNVNRLAVVEEEGSLIVVGLIDNDLIHASLKVDIARTLKKRQKYMDK